MALLTVLPQGDIRIVSQQQQKRKCAPMKVEREGEIRSRSQHVNGKVDKMKAISLEELEAANGEEKLWVAVRGNVYDLTRFLDRHPGGRDFLLVAAGKDVTSLYESMHSEKNTKVLR